MRTPHLAPKTFRAMKGVLDLKFLLDLDPEVNARYAHMMRLLTLGGYLLYLSGVWLGVDIRMNTKLHVCEKDWSTC
jgi:hypothetical protein